VDGIILCDLNGWEDREGLGKVRSFRPCISAPTETSVASQTNRLDVRAIVLFADFAADAIVDLNTRGTYSEFPPAV